MTIFHLASNLIHLFLDVELTAIFAQVYKRLKLTLELVKKEMEISKIQVYDGSVVGFCFSSTNTSSPTLFAKFYCSLNL